MVDRMRLQSEINFTSDSLVLEESSNVISVDIKNQIFEIISSSSSLETPYNFSNPKQKLNYFKIIESILNINSSKVRLPNHLIKIEAVDIYKDLEQSDYLHSIGKGLSAVIGIEQKGDFFELPIDIELNDIADKETYKKAENLWYALINIDGNNSPDIIRKFMD